LADRRKEQNIVLALMVALVMIMVHILVEHMPQGVLAKQEHACSGREGLNLTGASPVVPMARFRHVAIPQFVTGNRTFFAWCTWPGCLEDVALLR